MNRPAWVGMLFDNRLNDSINQFQSASVGLLQQSVDAVYDLFPRHIAPSLFFRNAK